MRAIAWKRLLFTSLGLLLTAGVAVAALPEDPVALLIKSQGHVEVERNGADERLPAQVGLQLQAGDDVMVGEGGQAVVLYRTGRMVKAAADVTIEDVEEGASSNLFSNTLRTLGQVATTDARTQPNRQGMIRPIAGAPAPIAPRNEIKVLSVRPTFTWFSVTAAAEYMIQIQRQGPDSPPPVRFSVGTDTTWAVPATEPPLIPGATYAWTVGGEGVGRVARTEKFTVASGEDVAALQDALGALIDAGIDPAEDGLFLTALAYRDAGFYYEARRAIAQIEEEGNASGRAFFMLKGEVLDALGEVDAAADAFRIADGSPAG